MKIYAEETKVKGTDNELDKEKGIIQLKEEYQEDEWLDHVTHIRRIRRLATNSIH